MAKEKEKDNADKLHPDVAYWLDEIKACERREKDFRKNGIRILEIYEAAKKEATPFNILFSNTETLQPALYSNTPRPVVQRRFKDDDPLGRSAAQAGQRVLEFQLDTNLEGYETFDEAMKAATMDGLLPGRAFTFVTYDASILEEPSVTDADATEPAYKEGELICCETKAWNRMYLGFARKWSKVPWIAEELFIDQEEATRLFGAAKAKLLKYSEGEPDASESTRRERERDERHQGRRKTVQIYQIWDKDGGKKVRYIAPSYEKGELKVDDDPLQLTGFFPCPRPLSFIDKTTSLTPTALYAIYETQAIELNRLTIRISHIVEAIKARGIYDGDLGGDLGNLMKADDNALVPAEKGSSLAAEKGLGNAIWFMPIEHLIATLMQLYQAREQVKQTIYEITGISDILRGASKASETLGAQQIKTQWGGLRLKNKQKEVARYARDLLRMMLELAAQNFSEETWAKMTGLPFLLDAKYNELTAVSQALQKQLSLQPAPAPVPGAPPNPLIQQLQQVQQQLQAPKWSDVLAMLKDDLQRAYRVDIETNSTVEPEATEDKQNMIEAMTIMGQFLSGVTPLVVSGSLPWAAAQSMLLVIVRRLRFGTDVEDQIKAMGPPTPPQEGDNGAAAAQQLKMEQQMGQQKMQLQEAQAQGELKIKGLQQDQQHAQRSTEQDVRELGLKHQEEILALKTSHAQEKLSLRDGVAQHKLQTDGKVAKLENSKFKTENVVNQKADQTLGKGMAGIEGIVKTLVQTVDKQSKENQAMLEQITKAITAPRTKKAIRGKDGRIEAVHEEVA